MPRAVVSFIMIVSLAIAWTTPAFAQGSGQGVAGRGQSRAEPTEKQKMEALERRQRLEETEKNYSATIKSQPSSKEKYDPWKGSR